MPHILFFLLLCVQQSIFLSNTPPILKTREVLHWIPIGRHVLQKLCVLDAVLWAYFLWVIWCWVASQSSCNVKSRCTFQLRGGSPCLLISNLPCLFLLALWPSTDVLLLKPHWFADLSAGHHHLISLSRSWNYDISLCAAHRVLNRKEKGGDAAEDSRLKRLFCGFLWTWTTKEEYKIEIILK